MITSFDYTHIEEECINLISRTACKLPQDVVSALKNAQCQEKDHSLSREVINQILLNIRLASDLKRPICQDTGTPVFYVTHPLGLSQKKLREIICSAVEKATKKGFLRPNAVHPLSGSNSGNNLGFHFPVIYF